VGVVLWFGYCVFWKGRGKDKAPGIHLGIMYHMSTCVTNLHEGEKKKREHQRRSLTSYSFSTSGSEKRMGGGGGDKHRQEKKTTVTAPSTSILDGKEKKTSRYKIAFSQVRGGERIQR